MTSAGTAPPSKGARTRARILEVATRLFARSGTVGVSLRDIAAGAEITHTGLLHHFPGGKDEVVLEVLERRDKVDADALLDPDRPALDHVVDLVAFAVRNARTPGLVALYAKLSNEATEPDHPAHRYFEQRYQVLRTYLERVFDEALPLDSPVTAATAAQQSLALLDGLQTQWLLAPTQIDMGRRFVDLLRLYGIEVDPGVLHVVPAPQHLTEEDPA